MLCHLYTNSKIPGCAHTAADTHCYQAYFPLLSWRSFHSMVCTCSRRQREICSSFRYQSRQDQNYRLHDLRLLCSMGWYDQHRTAFRSTSCIWWWLGNERHRSYRTWRNLHEWWIRNHYRNCSWCIRYRCYQWWYDNVWCIWVWQKVIRGLVIILAVVIDQTQRNLQAKMALQARNENK